MKTLTYRIHAENCFRRYDVTGNAFWLNMAHNWLKLATTQSTLDSRKGMAA